MSKWIYRILLVMIILTLPACTKVKDETQETTLSESAIEVVDDSGNTIRLEKPAERIISLYSAHTENIYELGAGDHLIGRGTSDIYPVEVLDKPVFDYRSDPEKVIAAEPDLVIIRPFIERKSPEFVETLKKVGIPVVSLYPESFDEFDDYIMKLGKLTGKETEAQQKLEAFYDEIESIEQKTQAFNGDVGVYFESTQTEYRTITLDSMPGRAIKAAGGYSVAGDLEPIQEGSSIASFGTERILEKAEDIDVYVSQRGAMNAGGNYHTIVIRPGFDTIKAVRDKRVFEINQKIISSPTFRYTKGIKEMVRMFYPEIADDYSAMDQEELITREAYAELMVKYTHRPIFVPTSKYYDKTYSQHTYGFFKDVKVEDPQFDMIETAVLAGYLDGYKIENEEWFYPEQHVTKDELAQTVILLSEFKSVENPINIVDLEESDHQRIVQMLVDNGIFDLEDGMFHPTQEVTGKDVIDVLERINEYKVEKGME